MTWPFENDTSAITKKLAKKSLQSEKRRNLMVVIAVALAVFLLLPLHCGISDLLYGNCVYLPDTNAAQSGCRYL